MNKQAFSISIATYCGFNQNIQYLIFFFLLFIPCLTLLACLYFLVCLYLNHVPFDTRQKFYGFKSFVNLDGFRAIFKITLY